MKIIANLGKVNRDKNLIIIEKGGHIEYVICRNFDEKNGCWSSGEYYYSMSSIAKGILAYTKTVNYDRMTEIATTAMSYLEENDILDDFLEDRYIDLDDEEKEFFFPEED